MSNQYRDTCVKKELKNRGQGNPLRVSFFDKDGTRVEDVTIPEAICIGNLDPTQLFYFMDGNGYTRELTIEEVKNLTSLDMLPSGGPPCPINPQLCGPPRVQFFGGNGLGAAANAIISPNSSSVIGFDIVSSGFNYLSPPYAQLIDECGNGSGATAFVRTETYDGTNDPGGRQGGTKGRQQVKDIVVTSPGRGYLPAPNGGKGGNEREVIPPPTGDTPETNRRPIVTFTASRYLITERSTVTLFWATENARTVFITELGSGLSLIGNRDVVIGETKTYVLTATGPGGVTRSQVTISLVLPPRTPTIPDPTTPPIVSFVSSKYEVNDLEDFTLFWQVSNATSVSIDQGIGEVDFISRIDRRITSTTTYVLTAVGAGGTVRRSITVRYITPVLPPIPPGPTPTPPPGPILPEPTLPPEPTPIPSLPPVPTPAPTVPPIIPPGPTPPPTTIPTPPPVLPPNTYKVIMCLDDVFVDDGGFGYVPGDTARVIPDNGSLVELEINDRGEIVAVKVISKGCGYTDIPEIIIESQTGYNAKLYPVLSATRITDEQQLFDIPQGVPIISVVDCVGVIPTNNPFDIVPR